MQTKTDQIQSDTIENKGHDQDTGGKAENPTGQGRYSRQEKNRRALHAETKHLSSLACLVNETIADRCSNINDSG